MISTTWVFHPFIHSSIHSIYLVIDLFIYCASLWAPNSCLAVTTTVSKYIQTCFRFRDIPKRDMLNVTQMLKHDYVQRKSRHKSNALDES